MARFYASFDNTTNSALEAGTTANFYQRVAISTGTTLQSALVSTRSALSTAVLAQLNVANRDGSLGIVVPPDVITRAAGDLSWTNVYTSTGAVWPADPRVRPTAQILSTNSTAVSPSDPGTISDTLYTDAQTALENCLTAMTGGGPRGRLGTNPWRTLASLWHDHNLTFLAWDDFTPGTVTNFVTSYFGGATNFTAELTWDGWEYRNDQNPSGRIVAEVQLVGPEVRTVVVDPATPFPSSRTISIPMSSVGNPLMAGTYSLSGSLTIYDPVITTHAGQPANDTETNVTI